MGRNLKPIALTSLLKTTDWIMPSATETGRAQNTALENLPSHLQMHSKWVTSLSIFLNAKKYFP